MIKLLPLLLLTGCLSDLGDSEPDYYDEPEPWHVTLHITAPVEFSNLRLQYQSGVRDDMLTFATPTATDDVTKSYDSDVVSIFISTTVDSVYYRGNVQAKWTDYDNPMADQTLHKFEATLALQAAE